MNRFSSALLALALGFAPCTFAQAQTSTHLNVPSANLVVLSGTSFASTTSWSVWQNTNWTPAYGHFLVPAGKVLVVTDLVFGMSTGNGYGTVTLTLWQNGFQILPGYQYRFNKVNAVQTFEKSFTGGLRIPAGTALDFSLTNLSGTASLDNVLVYGYFTN